MSIVSNTLTAYLPPTHKKTPSGWYSFNAPCCIHNGTTADKRSRGGLIVNGDERVSYSCFNCGFKASWVPGRNISHKMRKLMSWFGVSDSEINKIGFAVMRENFNISPEANSSIVQLPTFETVRLPAHSVKVRDLTEFNEYNIKILEYMASRNLDLNDTDYYWSPDLGYRDRLIIPYFYNNKIIGWTARTVLENKKPKYLADVQPGSVYGLDWQTHDRKFCIVTEGQLDALYVKGCGLGGADISEQQIMLLNRLNRQLVVVPDRDYNGKQLVEQALDLEWSVSMPEWPEDCKDIGDVVNRYGRLYALYSIAQSTEQSPLKIKLRAKKWFKKTRSYYGN